VIGRLALAPRSCSDCGKANPTVLIETTSGDRLCSRCWAETTRVPAVVQPGTPALDRHMARVEAQEAQT
jgi:hypothetical protein